MKQGSAILLASTLLFSAGAWAQSDSTAPNMQRTPDGVTPTPDSTSSASDAGGSRKHDRAMDRKSQQKHKGTYHPSSGGSADHVAPNMQRTPDGVTPTPDGTSVPSTR